MVIIMKIKKYIYSSLSGVVIGMVNGMLGAGGGLLTVPLLRKLGMEQKRAHANAIAVILPISFVSATLYLINGNVKFSDAWMFLPTGVIGALIGTRVLNRISPVLLKQLFGGFMVYAGVRLLLK